MICSGVPSVRVEYTVHMSIIPQGLHLAEAIGVNARALLALHSHLQKPLSKSTALLIFRLIELLKV